MHVEVNETNIDRYNLVELTGNSREFMLSKAADAAEKGFTISCNVPDEKVAKFNVFEEFESDMVDPRRLKGCGYEARLDTEGATHMVCVLHGKTTRHDLSKDPNAPCVQVDPAMKPTDEQINEGLNNLKRTCVYNKMEDPIEGTVYLCAVHGARSKYDISRLANMPCLVIEPRTPAEGDPHR